MPHVSTPPQHTLPSRAAMKRKAAARREDEAARLRSEAADYDRRWAEYVAERDAKPTANTTTQNA